MIKTIIFDIGGVITNTDFKALYTNFANRVGLTPEFVINYHKTKLEPLLLGDIGMEQFWKDMVDAGADPSLDLRAIWIEEGLKNGERNDELLDIVGKLRKKYSVGVLTNLTYSRLLLDEKRDLYSNFDYAVLSCTEHLKKPDPAFYKLALEKSSSKPEEAIFIDDREECILAAKAVGINAITYTYPDNKTFLENLKGFNVFISQ